MKKLKILFLNPPHKSIGSRLANEHLPPLGLLSIGGPLIDAGYDVQLLDADYSNSPLSRICGEVMRINPDLLLMGHSGSTAAQPIIDEISRIVKVSLPSIKIIVGGVYPTYHWREVLSENINIDYIVCGEGEAVSPELVKCLSESGTMEAVRGIAYRRDGKILRNRDADLIQNLDEYRIAWELMGNYHYTYWGKRKAVVIQFSRGCPYPCSYCGQSLFWKKWRNRSAQSLADEIEMLHEKYGVEVINFADENPSSNQKEWVQFLEALIEKNLDMTLVGSIRADNIVRDEAYLHLYKKAGFERFLLGIENYDEEVLKIIKKAGAISKDKRAIELLREHDILSMATYVVGFSEDKPVDLWNSLKQLLSYDPDQIQMLYATPHRWTPYFKLIKDKEIVQDDQSLWDYKHQVMRTPYIKPWQLVLYVKLIECIMQVRPKAIMRWLFHRDKKLRKAMFWYNNIGKRVWVTELFKFFFIEKRTSEKLSVEEFWMADKNCEKKKTEQFEKENAVLATST